MSSPEIAIHKYGGSSLATPERLHAVAERLIDTRRRGKQVAVVVSATGKTTDELIGRAREINPTPSRRELDMLLASGEQISSALVAMAIQQRGVDAVALTGRQCAIITDGTHGGARIVDVRPGRLREELARGRIVVVTGYQGVSADGELTTLGRGGSDTTAIALADALDAPDCEIYSDVDGVYSADPRVVPDAHRLEQVSYESMIELSRLGARVLNAHAVSYARERDVIIHARSTFSSRPGTIITDAGSISDGADDVGERLAEAVAGWTDVLRIRGRHRAPEEIHRAVEGHEILVDASSRVQAPHRPELPGRPEPIDLFVSGENIPDSEAFAAELAQGLGDDIEVDTRLGTVAVVGSPLGGSSEACDQARHALRAQGIEVLASTARTQSLICAVPERAVTHGLRVLHQTFVEPLVASQNAA